MIGLRLVLETGYDRDWFDCNYARIILLGSIHVSMSTYDLVPR